MEKRKKWHLFLILSVIILTFYHIFPTIFYYSKPLQAPVSEEMGGQIASEVASRVNGLKDEAELWVRSFCDLLQIKPVSLEFVGSQSLKVRFSKEEDAARLRTYLPRAGSLIGFAPAQLQLADLRGEEIGKSVLIKRKIPIELSADMFCFAKEGSEAYRHLIVDRASYLGSLLVGPSEETLFFTEKNGNFFEPVYAFALKVQLLEKLPKESPFYRRFASSLVRGAGVEPCIKALERAREECKRLGEKEPEIEKKKAVLTQAIKILKEQTFLTGETKFDGIQQIKKILESSHHYAMGGANPYFSSLSIDWENQKIFLELHPDIKKMSQDIKQWLFDEIGTVCQLSGESIPKEIESGYEISFHQKPDTKNVLILDTRKVNAKLIEQAILQIKQAWHPSHPDLLPEHFSIIDFDAYQTLSPEKKALCLVFYTPVFKEEPPPKFQKNGIYCFAKGLQRIAQGYEQFPDSDLAKLFQKDLTDLQSLLYQEGFRPYLASQEIEGLNADIIFEHKDSLDSLLTASREEFVIKTVPFLELSTQEERIIAENKIETAIHEDLLKWHDEYSAARVHLNPAMRYDVPKPTKNLFWNNLKLHWRKLFRGDEKKVIRWGLDLSGGKTLQIELKDANGKPVTSDIEIKQGINELYKRVNKKGVSEVSIRQVGDQIVLDFPGSQALSGAELVRSSSMFFHIVNETFSHPASPFAETAHRFLQEVWNEAKISGKTDEKNLQEIAWKHLYGDNTSHPKPRSESARRLLESGLELASPSELARTSELNQKTSKIARYRGEEISNWHGQTHPLLIVFNNFALEGAHLENIRASYDPSKGNYLSFEVQKSAGSNKNPSKELQAWTSVFSRPQISGTQLETYSKGQGWRMAVILNGSVIASPTLNESLQDSAMISGSFSQREVNQLAADLKAGSLTFTPHILSEKNVSPELGKEDRARGILATCIALLLVIGSMILYYRFAGFVASIAVIMNLFIMWAALQHLGASLSLAGIAGLILTVGMAVDANVLVFERIKEEFALTKKIQSAISSGYKKAFSAIFDSNITTIIAALVLLNFDAGPIKAFAITLIIGIASSMFTALFMTRFYFSYWTENPKNTSLSMANWIQGAKFDFLKWTKPSLLIAALIIMVGGALLYKQSTHVLGMDFTGGFALNLEVAKDQKGAYRERVEEALLAQGLSKQDFQVRELTPSHHLRLLLSSQLEESGKVFASLPVEDKNSKDSLNSRIEWILEALQASQMNLTDASKAKLPMEWTHMSGQMSSSMQSQAIIGLLIACIAIFIYIVFRFEYKFALAAILCLVHDVFITVSLISILHFFGISIQIDLHTIAALMTIIGYSLNDTIIIFDRIREDMYLSPQKNLSLIVNQALNATLSRTSITSGTTLLVLLALVALGGGSIFGFALVMLIGVIFGTLSSWFIASPLMLYFHRKADS